MLCVKYENSTTLKIDGWLKNTIDHSKQDVDAKKPGKGTVSANHRSENKSEILNPGCNKAKNNKAV